ncbi:DUF2306 domain-containing protein [Cellulomonas sp. PhB150]|uniref:DUF2306 domain-containing protein n=1 Tax=Cellulomonas sp. PhB150 TaxID=2485188 RepID=UPI000F4A880F|nr:DUF2306 domain-containing protein [Cellulomonas sp. PhB150]ROS27748.1 putative membrane protein [Cellulomonas sp. PhB150]
MTTTDTTPAPRPTAVRQGSRISWAVVVLTSVAIATYAVSPYLVRSLEALASDDVGLAPGYAGRGAAILAAFYLHVVAGGTALLVGPFQFWAGLRRRRPAVHRALGRTYLGAVGVAGLAALVLAPVNTAGLVGFLGFGTLAVLWLLTAWRGYRSVRSGDVRAHQAWMIRSFALTYAAVTLRAWTGVLIAAQVPFVSGTFDPEAAFANAYAAVPFLCWLPNLVVAEWLVRRRGLPTVRIVELRD